jgi:hypothetical protein
MFPPAGRRSSPRSQRCPSRSPRSTRKSRCLPRSRWRRRQLPCSPPPAATISTGAAGPHWVIRPGPSSANMPASGCRASCETGLAADLRAVIGGRGVRLGVRQSWPMRPARLPVKASPRGGPASPRAGCAGSTSTRLRWCPMGAMRVATSGGTARTPAHAPNAGPQRGARHGPPRWRRGVALPQSHGAALPLGLVPDALADFARRARRGAVQPGTMRRRGDLARVSNARGTASSQVAVWRGTRRGLPSPRRCRRPGGWPPRRTAAGRPARRRRG